MAADTNIGSGESPEVRAVPVLLAIALIIGTVALIGFGLELFFPDRVGLNTVGSHPFPAPAVVPGERSQRLELEAAQRHDLAGAKGRKPIDDAMREIASKGVRAYDPIGGPP